MLVLGAQLTVLQAALPAWSDLNINLKGSPLSECRLFTGVVRAR
jgi:hypothetical protein